jgi:hypothetical protein
MKKCSKCQQYKLPISFGLKSAAKDKLQSACKKCLNLEAKLYRARNNDGILSEMEKEAEKKVNDDMDRFIDAFCVNEDLNPPYKDLSLWDKFTSWFFPEVFALLFAIGLSGVMVYLLIFGAK